MRVETDKVISVIWLIIILVLSISSIFFMFSIILVPINIIDPSVMTTLMFLSWIPGIIGFIITMVLIYKLVKRRNTHFRRQILLFEDIINVVKELANKKGVDIKYHIDPCERIIREAKIEETEKNAVLWVIISFITGGIALLYVYYFLMKDFYKHERREDFFWEDIGKALNTCGLSIPPLKRTIILPDRNFILYLILTIITIGIFMFYWLYVLIKDPNEHFKYHTIIEDELLKRLEAATAEES